MDNTFLKQSLQTRHSQLTEEYEAVQQQLGYTLSDADKLRLERQATQIEQEMRDLNGRILELDRVSSSASHEATMATNRLQATLELASIFAQRFDSEELRTFCLHLDLDYDDLSPGGKVHKARELALYLDRHNRLDEAISIGKRLRPDIDWTALPAAQS